MVIKGLDIVVAQKEKIILEIIKGYVEEKRREPGTIHNKIYYAEGSTDAFKRIEKNGADILVTGQRFDDLINRSGTDFAGYVKMISPDIWVFGYTLLQGEKSKQIIGYIQKKVSENRDIIDFLTSPKLAEHYRNKDIKGMKRDFPYIQFN
jgi:hypothetical protein